MDMNRIIELHKHYSDALLKDCIPFWLEHSLDNQHGGYLTCLDRNGRVFNTDKSVWFQGRGTWLFSRLHNTVEPKQEWLDAARLGYRFLTEHCFDTDGRMFFQTTRDGKPLRKRRYFFSETFAIMAFAEYYRASGELEALKKARDLYKLVSGIYLDPSKDPYKITPKVLAETRAAKTLAPPMILLNVIQNLRENDPERISEYDAFASGLVDQVLNDFLKPEALLETVGMNGERLDCPAGRCVNPGHSIETAWFLLHEGAYRADQTIIDKALSILDRSWEIGWDKEYGGLYSFVDIEGKPPEQLEWDMKLWWPHTETLYAALLANHITGDKKYESWYEQTHEWAFTNFRDRNCGEWYGYLHRDGTVSNTLKGSMWKGPFHLPRALLLNTKLLEAMMSKANQQ